MVKHYIIMSSSYTDGTRIALDITDGSLLNSQTITEIIQDIKRSCGEDVPLSTHLLETETDMWSSVAEYDPFFADVVCVKSVAELLVYFAYADYLCDKSARLFEDTIYAFVRGPVIASVYETYKRSGDRYVEPLEHGYDGAIRTDVNEMPAKSRILFAKNGPEKLRSIDRTIETYGKYTAGELVARTHRDGSPWSKVDGSKAYQIIPDQLIMKYHFVECA